MLQEAVREYLAGRTVAEGEIVAAGWLLFRIGRVGPPIEFESLDFTPAAAFTTDLTKAEEIFAQQFELQRRCAFIPEPCTLRDTAIISKSYAPGHPRAFLKRDAATTDRDSGWYLGILEDPLDPKDPASFVVSTLYEVSVADRRTFPYWLMPAGSLVSLELGVLASSRIESAGAD